jgi:hypothetical protein
MIGCARNSAPPSPGFFCDPAPPDIAGNWGSGSGDHMPAAVEWEITARETILNQLQCRVKPDVGFGHAGGWYVRRRGNRLTDDRVHRRAAPLFATIHAAVPNRDARNLPQDRRSRLKARRAADSTWRRAPTSYFSPTARTEKLWSGNALRPPKDRTSPTPRLTGPSAKYRRRSLDDKLGLWITMLIGGGSSRGHGASAANG